jgi:hypothetical protein
MPQAKAAMIAVRMFSGHDFPHELPIRRRGGLD